MILGHVGPRLAANQFPHRIEGHSAPSRERSDRGPGRMLPTQEAHLVLSELCKVMRDATWATPTATGLHLAHVLGMSPQMEMVRAYAATVIASMQHVSAIRNRPVRQFPRNAMRVTRAPFADSDPAVAESTDCRRPLPAAVATGRFFPEPLSQIAHARKVTSMRSTSTGAA
jgi:hypothetical protein